MQTKELENFNLDIILSNWEACMVGRSFKEREVMWWSPPPEGVLKFNVDGAARGKLGLTGISGVLHNHGVLHCFFLFLHWVRMKRRF